MQTSNAWVIVCMCLKHVEVWVKGGAGEYERDLLWTSSGGLTGLQGLGVRAKIKRKWATVCSFQEKPGVYVPVHRLEMINCTDSTWHTWSCKARKSKINWISSFTFSGGLVGWYAQRLSLAVQGWLPLKVKWSKCINFLHQHMFAIWHKGKSWKAPVSEILKS